MAKGSHATRGGWEPKHCAICNDKVVLSHKPALRFHLDHLTGWAISWHVDCEQPGWPHLKEDSCSPPSPT